MRVRYLLPRDRDFQLKMRIINSRWSLMMLMNTGDHMSDANLLKEINPSMKSSNNNKSLKYPEKRTIKSIITMMISNLVLIKVSMILKYVGT
jgi:hypothetical protein